MCFVFVPAPTAAARPRYNSLRHQHTFRALPPPSTMSARGRRGDIAVAEGADDVGDDSDEEAAAAEEEQVGSIKTMTVFIFKAEISNKKNVFRIRRSH